MNKLSFAVVEKLFLEKNPEGKIYQKDNKTCVVFKPETKVYEYQTQNNLELIKKLNLTNDNIIYTHDYTAFEKHIKELEEKIEKGYTESFFEESGIYTYNEKELENMQIELKWLQEKAENAILI